MIIDIQAVAQTPEQKQEFMDSLNKYRIAAGSDPVKYDYYADSLAQLRIQTICSHLDDIDQEEYSANIRKYLHYNIDADYKTYEEFLIATKQDSIGWSSECAAHLSKWMSNNPASIHIKLFQGWKNSQDHWNVMLDSRLRRIALAWKYHNGQIVASLVIFDLDSN